MRQWWRWLLDTVLRFPRAGVPRKPCRFHVWRASPPCPFDPDLGLRRGQVPVVTPASDVAAVSLRFEPIRVYRCRRCGVESVVFGWSRRRVSMNEYLNMRQVESSR